MVHLYRQCQINENKLKPDVCYVYKYLKTVHTSFWLSQTAVLILWWIGPTHRKSNILFRLAGCPELKMKENVPVRALGLWGAWCPGAGTQHKSLPTAWGNRPAGGCAVRNKSNKSNKSHQCHWGVQKDSFAALAPGAQRLQLLSWRHLSLAKIHWWKWWKPLHEALQLFSSQEDGTRLLVPVTVLEHCCDIAVAQSCHTWGVQGCWKGIDSPELMRWAGSFQSFWFYLLYRKGFVKCECCLVHQSPACTGRLLDVRRALSPGVDLSGGRHSWCGMGLCFPVIAIWSEFLLIVRTGWAKWKCSLPHQQWGGDAWSELLHSCRQQGAGGWSFGCAGGGERLGLPRLTLLEMQRWWSHQQICAPGAGCGTTQWVPLGGEGVLAGMEPSDVQEWAGGSRGVQAALLGATATGIPWLWTLLSCSFVHGMKCSWGDTSPQSSGGAGGCRFVTAKAFHGALSLGTLASSAASCLSFPALWEVDVWFLKKDFLASQVLNVVCIYICEWDF